MGNHNEVINEALSGFPERGRATSFADLYMDDPVYKEDAVFALTTPDLYPGKVVAAVLGVGVMKVHSWRKERGIKKARS